METAASYIRQGGTSAASNTNTGKDHKTISTIYYGRACYSKQTSVIYVDDEEYTC
jgi:hypothetical protein